MIRILNTGERMSNSELGATDRLAVTKLAQTSYRFTNSWKDRHFFLMVDVHGCAAYFDFDNMKRYVEAMTEAHSWKMVKKDPIEYKHWAS